MRNITNMPENAKIPQNIRILIKTNHFEIKHAATLPKANVDILDKKSAHIITMSNGYMKEMEVLRSNNPAMVDLAQDYFDMKWKTATTPQWNKKNHQNETKLEAHEPSVA